MVLAGLKPEAVVEEYIGYDSLHGPLATPPDEETLNEVRLRLAIKTRTREEAARLFRLVPPLALSGPPGASGAIGANEPRQLLGMLSALVPRAWQVRVEVVAS